jgi:hypothetical protein
MVHGNDDRPTRRNAPCSLLIVKEEAEATEEASATAEAATPDEPEEAKSTEASAVEAGDQALKRGAASRARTRHPSSCGAIAFS